MCYRHSAIYTCKHSCDQHVINVRPRVYFCSRMSSSEGKPITCKAAVAWAPKEELTIETVEVAPPKKGEGKTVCSQLPCRRTPYDTSSTNFCASTVPFCSTNQDLVDCYLPHRLVHMVWGRSRGNLPLHPRPRRNRYCGECGRGRHQRGCGGQGHPPVHS